MYIPAWFREDNLAVLHDLMRQFSFATLVTQGENAPFASHLPFLLDTERGEYGTLRAHLARPNPQWKQLREGEVLVLFQGPHAYISPSWYLAHPSVPTWNYAVVHAYGVPRLLDDAELRATLQETVATYESGFDVPWRLNSLSEEYVAKMAGGIVGIEIAITRLEGKFKLSQNRSETDRQSVIAALQASGDPLNMETAKMMATRQGVRE